MATAATTSGTVGTTVIDVSTLIEHAYRRCGKLPSTISSEQQLGARESLFFLLTDLVNEGISLWCIKRTVIPAVVGDATYGLPPGTADVMSVNWRTYQALTGSTISGAGYQGLSFDPTPTSPTNVQVSFASAGTPALVVEYSQDNVTWSQAAQFDAQQSVLAAGTAISTDILYSPPALFWRVRDTSGTLLPVASMIWSNTPSDIPMTAYNRDEYWNLPNKTFLSSRSLQYWYDKQINPQLFVWPVPNTPAAQMVVQYQRQIQDVGSFTNLIEVPQRWYEYVIFALACRVAIELPPQELAPGRLEYLEGKVVEHMNRAANSESDGSATRLAPNLRGYT